MAKEKAAEVYGLDELEDRVAQGTKKVESLKNKYKNKRDYIKTITLWSVPFQYKKMINASIFNKEVYFDWGGYKTLLLDEWKDLTINRRVIHPNVGTFFYLATLAGFITATVLAIIDKVPAQINMNMFSFSALSFVIFELITGIVSTVYYLFRPNLINKSQAKRELKVLAKELKIAENEFKISTNLLEQYKIAHINPMKKFTEVKARNIEDLMNIVVKAELEVLPKVSNAYRESFGNTLEKSKVLLEMGKEDGRIITEIHKIYVIYINDISDILLKEDSGDSLTGRLEVVELLKNFSNYLDKKIEKFEKVNQILIDSNISALNKAFMEEE